MSTAEVYKHPAVRKRVREILSALATRATGSSTRIQRALIADQPPSLDIGEITDKGSLNQRVILRHRTAWVDALYAEPVPDHVFRSEGKITSPFAQGVAKGK